MKKYILILFATIILISFTSADYQTYYKLDLHYNNGKINISNLEIVFNEKLEENYFGFYSFAIVDYNNELLNASPFGVPNVILWDGIDNETGEISFGGEYTLEEVEFEIIIPYFENAKEIIIYDENLIERDRIDVSMYSKEYKEDLIEEELIEEEVILEEESSKADEEKIDYIEKIENYWWILVIILIFLILKLVWDLSSKKQK